MIYKNYLYEINQDAHPTRKRLSQDLRNISQKPGFFKKPGFFASVRSLLGWAARPA